MSGTTLMLLAMIVPATAGAGVALCGRWPNLRETVTLSAAAVLLWVILQLLSPMLAGESAPAITLGSPLPGLVVAFTLEPLGMLFALIAAALWLVSSCYSIGYMRANDETNQT
ncbi:MAG: monovalent cation/H+ antiporter subunit D family protein, partial [Betaproteobacteria bacterium]|nr:monovalent cation/H+ antiporter subunit D family protein [Betaproteobacteria bacterium]